MSREEVARRANISATWYTWLEHGRGGAPSADVLNHGSGVKRLRHPVLGPIELEYSSFAVDGRPELGMIVYNPVSAEDTARIRTIVKTQRAAAA